MDDVDTELSTSQLTKQAALKQTGHSCSGAVVGVNVRHVEEGLLETPKVHEAVSHGLSHPQRGLRLDKDMGIGQSAVCVRLCVCVC